MIRTRLPLREHSRALAAYARRETRTEIFREQGGACADCGRPMRLTRRQVPNQATIDHRTPLSRGGEDKPSNWRICCFACNQAKADGPVPGLVAETCHCGFDWKAWAEDQYA